MATESNGEFSGDLHDSEPETASESSRNSSVSSCLDLLSCEDNLDNLEPLATEQEAAEYAQQVAQEEEEEVEFSNRFSGESDVNVWCSCSRCSLDRIVKAVECTCCKECDRCMEKMEDVGKENECITLHPAFDDVCLNRWVLEIAAIGLKTKRHKSYTTLFYQGHRTESEFLRSVAYRQFVRLVWEYVGSSRRFPLPSCVYNKIRTAFPDEGEEYRGFEEEEEES